MPIRQKKEAGEDLRGLRLPVHLLKEEEGLYKDVLHSLDKYRGVARKMFGAVFQAYAAGAELIDTGGEFKLKPVKKAAENILGEVFGKPPGAAELYSLRDWVRQEALGEDWLSFVWDSLRATTWQFWKAHDPEFPKCTREFLVTNGSRALAQCRFIGIKFPAATARPKFNKRSIVLKFRHSLGPVEFHLNQKIDGGKWRRWAAIRDGILEHGTVTLSERDGKLFVLLPYREKKELLGLDKNKVAKLTFGASPEEALLLDTVGAEKEDQLPLSACSLLGVLVRLRKQQEDYEKRKGAAGSKTRSWGFKKAFVAEQNKVGKLTLARTGLANDWNHVWSKRIAWYCRDRGCGTLDVDNPPEKLFGEPWAWHQFVQHLQYKVGHYGIALVLQPEKKEEKAK
jgi:hypothetical protein